ncbi:MAG TPA: hypothetical protein VHW01_00860 [Polyangiaceae bacterium]|jgi:ABC-type phosphate transport system substrate-binding protein|nr:hypothetical protein [Polyangiaceae bacterium]
MQNKSRRIRRALAVCATGLGVCLLAPTFFTSKTAKADAIPDCSTLSQHVVYVSGSSAIGPVISRLAYYLAKAGDPLTIVADNVLNSPGSCGGLNVALSTNLSGTSQYWPNDPTQDPDYKSPSGVPTAAALCNLPSQRADIGASDVYPTSCPQITADSLAGFKDFDPGFAQAMEFIKPQGDNQSPASISQEAAYLTFGFGADSTTEWHDPTKIFVRDQSSGTMQMISKAIGVPANKVVSTNVVSSTPNMESAVSGAGTAAIGIISATDGENPKTGMLSALAFQATGQSCAYWPNSEATAHDKARVRDGHYLIWGRFHVVVPVDGEGNPTNPDVARLINILTNKEQVAGVNVLDLLIDNYTIPECAMHVSRDSEIGPISPFTPPQSCDCYFDLRVGTIGAQASCTACQTDADCTDTTKPKCNHWGAKNDGYCEVQ